MYLRFKLEVIVALLKSSVRCVWNLSKVVTQWVRTCALWMFFAFPVCETFQWVRFDLNLFFDSEQESETDKDPQPLSDEFLHRFRQWCQTCTNLPLTSPTRFKVKTELIIIQYYSVNHSWVPFRIEFRTFF